jgi:hypothetical protein
MYLFTSCSISGVKELKQVLIFVSEISKSVPFQNYNKIGFILSAAECCYISVNSAMATSQNSAIT